MKAFCIGNKCYRTAPKFGRLPATYIGVSHIMVGPFKDSPAPLDLPKVDPSWGWRLDQCPDAARNHLLPQPYSSEYKPVRFRRKKKKVSKSLRYRSYILSDGNHAFADDHIDLNVLIYWPAIKIIWTNNSTSVSLTSSSIRIELLREIDIKRRALANSD